MKKLLLLFLGVIATASLIGGIHVAQGFILDDWSGVHPYYRVFQVPVIVAIGFSIGVLILLILRVMKLILSGDRSEYFKLGLILGFAGISSLIHSYVNSGYTDWLVVLIVFISSLLVAVIFASRQ